MRVRAAVLTALAGAALAVPAAPAVAAACDADTGVTVVVDFASVGGGTQTRCASGDPSSGLAALRGVGFRPTRAAQEPGYFVCRIDGKPANDPCQRTSPADAYWSYWHAKPGGTWSYSSAGPADYDPAAGTVDGWAFGAGKPPSVPPPRARPATQPSASPTAAAASPAPAPARSPSTRSATPAPSAPVTRTMSPPASPSASADAAPQPSAADPGPSPIEDRSADGQTSIGLNDDGPGAGVVVAIVVLLGLGAAGLLQVRARRRQARL